MRQNVKKISTICFENFSCYQMPITWSNKFMYEKSEYYSLKKERITDGMITIKSNCCYADIHTLDSIYNF